jgi:hypothetical protein
VQNITFTLTGYTQGTTTTNKSKSVITTAPSASVDTKNVIAFLSTNKFSTSAKLVLVVRNNGLSNSVTAFEIRDGTNAPVVITNLSVNNSFSVKSSTVQTNGIATGVKYSLLSLSLTNSTVANTIVSLSGFATTTHASIKDGKEILSVDSLIANVSGTYNTNGVLDAVVKGTVNVSGSTISKIQ